MLIGCVDRVYERVGVLIGYMRGWVVLRHLWVNINAID